MGHGTIALIFNSSSNHGTGLVQVGVDVGLVNDEGLRGTTAARDFQRGEVVVRVPRNCTLALGPHAWTPAVRCPPSACVPPAVCCPPPAWLLWPAVVRSAG